MFEPYTAKLINGKWYVEVITYNPVLWYPWNKKYIGKTAYPVNDLHYAMSFDTESEANEFIKEKW